MKYLVKFNEDLVNREELKDFCEMYLAYLTDEGFELNIREHNASDSWPSVGNKDYPELGYQTNYFRVSFYKTDNSLFFWEEVSDRFIPFVKYLIDNYKLLKIDPRSTIKYCFGLEFATGTNSRFKTKELLDGTLLEGKKLRSISFVVGLPK